MSNEPLTLDRAKECHTILLNGKTNQKNTQNNTQNTSQNIVCTAQARTNNNNRLNENGLYKGEENSNLHGKRNSNFRKICAHDYSIGEKVKKNTNFFLDHRTSEYNN